jgi:hypothetical protein
MSRLAWACGRHCRAVREERRARRHAGEPDWEAGALGAGRRWPAARRRGRPPDSWSAVGAGPRTAAEGGRPQVRGPAGCWRKAPADWSRRPHPYQGSAHRLVSPGWHLRPGRTMDRWRPLETVANRSGPMACGPNVDQTRPAQPSQWLPSGAGPWGTGPPESRILLRWTPGGSLSVHPCTTLSRWDIIGPGQHHEGRLLFEQVFVSARRWGP